MREYNPKETLVSLHLPKCAGTSFNNALKKSFFPFYFRHYYNQKTGRKPWRIPKIEWISNINPTCIHGHFDNRKNIGAWQYYPQAKQFISIMREPSEIRVSMYNYIRQSLDSDSYFHNGRKIKEFTTSIDDFLKEGKLVLMDHLPFDINEGNYKKIIDTYFVHFGIYEKLQGSIDRLGEILNKSSIKLPHLNQTSAKEFPSKRALDVFRDNHKLEYRIYDYLVSKQ